MFRDLAARDMLKKLLADLSLVKLDGVAATLTKHVETGALRAVNNSTVGTSKLLHFFFPEKVPIWDSVLGKSFGLVHDYEWSREDRFIKYVQEVHAAVQLERMPWAAMNFADCPGFEASKVRKIEFTLYAFARRNRHALAARA
ncbi:hypothetical protein ML401_20580 [Bradyrhizobium sp. 62B]|uniref:hypothetical protein n=1 Tax=Bradyrhizobium sp. 62B TaxID=2898442 RepID=UPI002557FBAF|nr:hypothetical protein ML401_20580 [Bradyrhizobium sp. 62B]